MKTASYKTLAVLTLAATVMVSTSCMKDFLDMKRDKSQVIPVTLEDYRSIFEHQDMNTLYPVWGEVSADDYYISVQQWNGLSDPAQKNAYVWAEDIFQEETSLDWNRAYAKILYANFVLEGVIEIAETPENKAFRDEIIGAAHFFRATSFFQLAQIFCKSYNPTTARGDLGLPLRTTSNINVQYQRATLEETYDQIIGDLEVAAGLLPHTMSLNLRPYRAAALGVLANVYLQLGDYQSAFNNVDAALALAPEILDYNEVDTSLAAPFAEFGWSNKEIVFFSNMSNATILSSARLTVDSLLYGSYHDHDLRKQAFFTINSGRLTYKQGYSQSVNFMFNGITTPELFLVRAECNARLGDINSTVTDLNWLLSHRFKPEYFAPIGTNISQTELLHIVLSERRKELVYRGRRWHDLKRFQQDTNLAQPLKRVLDGTEYNLPIGSPKWVLPIPPDVVRLGGLVQNER